jgi:hypothetical protein
VVNVSCAIWCNDITGPFFGNDLAMYAPNKSTNCTRNRCKKAHYEKKIRDSEDYFAIADYEVFQIIKR